MTTTATPPRFVRDRLTALGYGGLAAYAYLLYALGPLLPLLRDDLHQSYVLMSLHSTAFAGGAVLTNLLFERIRRRLGYRALFWSALAGLALGSMLLAAGAWGTAGWLTLTAAALAGIGGSLLQTTALALLAEHHGALRERALVEANAGASATALAAPLIVGGLQAAGTAWNWSLLLPPIAAAVLYAAFRREPVHPGGREAGTAQREPGGETATPLPAGFWTLAALCGVVVGTEFCLVFYGSPQLTTVHELTDGQASTAMGLFYGGELLGRLAGSRLTGGTRWSTPRLVLAALALSGMGFLALWASSVTWLALTGLFLSGLGIANLFPLTLSLAVSAAGRRTGRATARVQLLVGAAIMLAPLLLASLSDGIGVRPAFGLGGVLIMVAMCLLALGRRHTRPPVAHHHPQRKVPHSLPVAHHHPQRKVPHSLPVAHHHPQRMVPHSLPVAHHHPQRKVPPHFVRGDPHRAP
ncbi:hypothetical protein ACZ90_45075 [Streptomyces albus subsp. albus]|nr:hypothetical protein ACZ90_45075 [Streptomyces albus subsp. albus]